MNVFEFIAKVYAADDTIVGSVNPGKTFLPYGNVGTTGAGIVLFITNIIRLAFVGAGIWAFFNFIIAGYQFMTAGGDSKAIMSAWNRIWQTLLGLILIVGSFALIALFGYILFGDAGFILNPKIYGPK